MMVSLLKIRRRNTIDQNQYFYKKNFSRKYWKELLCRSKSLVSVFLLLNFHAHIMRDIFVIFIFFLYFSLIGCVVLSCANCTACCMLLTLSNGRKRYIKRETRSTYAKLLVDVISKQQQHRTLQRMTYIFILSL